MPKDKKIKDSAKRLSLAEQIERLAENLYYISETDAPILPFTGERAEASTKEILMRQIGIKSGVAVEERDFREFFEHLTRIQDWFGDEEKQSAEKFRRIQNLLEQNLSDLKVFKVGRIEIDIYVVGLDSSGKLMGIKTSAVET